MINKIYTALFIGINSGLIYGLLGSTVTAYFTDMKVQLVTLGFLTLRIMPYSFKYIWAPVVDSIKINLFPPHFGQRKSWIISTQIILIILIICLGFIDISKYFILACALTLVIAVFAATYDIAMEAYRIELFEQEKSNRGNSIVVLGFRIGLIISSAFALYLASMLEWKWVFIIMAILILPCILVVCLSEDNKKIDTFYDGSKFKFWVKGDFINPFIILFRLPQFYLIFLLIAFYKVSDGYLDAMLFPYLTHIGFSKVEIAKFTSTVGIIANIFGAFTGAYLIHKFGIIKILLAAELLASISNLLFIALINIGKNNELLFFITSIESFCSGICNITLISYMSSICHKRFTATHYAILISISSFSRVLLSSTSGLVVVEFGWVNFFIISALLSVPSLLCILVLYRSTQRTVYKEINAVVE